MTNRETPTILLDFKKNRIRIHSCTLQLIGPSGCFRLLVHPEQNVLVLQICDSGDIRSFHGCGKERSSEIYSCSFMRQLRACGQWNDQEIYRFRGKIVPSEGVVLFNLNNATQTREC